MNQLSAGADKRTTENDKRDIHHRFGRFATAAANWLGSAWAFAGAGLVVMVWAASGPIFHFSPIWTQAITTGTGLATFLMVFLIQNMQNRDARAINLKLNELILAMDKARNQLIDIERLSDLELDELQGRYEKIKTAWSARNDAQRGDRAVPSEVRADIRDSDSRDSGSHDSRTDAESGKPIK
jgi:low affinity Fe/Cu permease